MIPKKRTISYHGGSSTKKARRRQFSDGKKDDNLSGRIPGTKILRLSTKNGVDRAKLISNDINVVISSDYSALKNFLQNKEYEKYPNIFVIIIEESLISENCNEINSNFPTHKLLLIQSGITNEINFYIRDVKNNIIKQYTASENNTECTKKFLGLVKQSLHTLDLNQLGKIEELFQLHIDAINTDDELVYRLLNLFNFKFNIEEQITISKLVIKKNTLNMLLAHLNLFDEKRITKELITSHFMIPTEECQERLLLHCIRSKNSAALKNFLKHNTFKIDKFKKAIDLAIDTGFLEFLDMLQVIDDSTIKKIIEQKIKVLNEIEAFHENITKENTDEIKKFIEKYNQYRLCYGRKKVCALEHAIDEKKFKIYSFLRANNFYTDSSVILTKIKDLSEEHKNLIRKENLKYTKQFSDSFIGMLLSKIEFDSCSPIETEDFKDMLQKLSKIEINGKNYLLPLFKYAANSNPKIVLDYESSGINSMNPSCDENVHGIFYPKEGLLCMGKNVDRLKRWGTFVHELTHYVLLILYDNDCKPYCKDDEKRSKIWKSIISKLKQELNSGRKEMEEIIKLVFRYDEKEHECEMAVRACQMVACYSENENFLLQVREKYLDLFNFYEQYILPDLENTLNNLNYMQIRKLNEKFKNFTRGLKLKSENSLNLCDKQIVIYDSNIPNLTLSMIYEEIRSKTKNKIDVTCKNIFIDCQKMDIKKLNNLVNSSNIERVVFDYSNIKKKDTDKTNLRFLSNFKNSVKILIVKHNNLKLFGANIFTTKKLQHTWRDISKETQETILDKIVNFQGNDGLKLKEIYTPDSLIPENILKLLWFKDIKINVKDIKALDNFIDRDIKQNKVRDQNEQNNNKVNEKDVEQSSLSLLEFIEKTKSKNIVLISDNAGSGKTWVLRKVREIFLDRFNEIGNRYFFICFITLKDHLKKLESIAEKKFEEAIVKILNFKDLEATIFKQKLSKGEVKIFYDGFDEISPDFKEQMISHFKKFQKIENSCNQIYISTRTHLEEDLETELNVTSYSLENFGREKQIQVLINYWGLDNYDSDNEEIYEKCATQLVDKLAESISSINAVIGSPLIVQKLAEIYKNEINENFESVIKDLNISQIYLRIVLEANLQKINLTNLEYMLKSDSILKVYEILAIKHLFDESMLGKLNLYYNDEEWTATEIERGGIIKIEEEQTIFYHETYAEYLVAHFTYGIIKNVSYPSIQQKSFLKSILCDKKFKVTRVFLNDMLKPYKTKELKILSAAPTTINVETNVLKLSDKNVEDLNIWTHEMLPNLVKFVLQVLKLEPKRITLFFENPCIKCHNRTFLMEFLPKITKSDILKFFLTEVFEFYGDDVYEKFLRKTDINGYNILHMFSISKTNSSCTKAFLEKVLSMENEIGKSKLLAYTTLKGKLSDALTLSIRTRNEIFFYELFDEFYCRFFTLSYMKTKSDCFNSNFLNNLVTFGSYDMISHVLKSFDDFLSSIEKSEIMQQDAEFSYIKFAAYRKKTKELEIIFDFVEKSVQESDFKKMLKTVFKYLISNQELSPMWQKYAKYFTINEFKENFFIHILAQKVKCQESCKKLIDLILQKLQALDEINCKKILLFQKDRMNALYTAIHFKNGVSFPCLLIQLYLKYFKEKKLISLKNEENNLLHNLAKYGTTSMIKCAFQHLLKKTSLKKLNIPSPNIGQNFIHICIMNQSLSDLSEIFEILKNCMVFKNKNKKFQKYLKSKTQRGSNIITLLMLRKANDDDEIKLIRDLIIQIKKYLGEEFKELLCENDKTNNILQHCCQNKRSLFPFVFYLYENAFARNQIQTFLSQIQGKHKRLSVVKDVLKKYNMKNIS